MRLKYTLALVATLFSNQVLATAYQVPPAEKALVGDIKYTTSGFNTTIAQLQTRYDLGYNAIEDANPHINFSQGIPHGAPVKMPARHLLPSLAREGIVVNLPEMRMYYYPPGKNVVYTYPIGIGKVGKTIPITNTSITKKVTNPQWSPPDDIREWNLETQGVVLPKIMPAGPDNPLGPYAIYMDVPTYLIHSTIFPESIGKRASFGCIRMYESDIQEFFPSIESGIPVAIINSPTKVGWQDDTLYMEAFRPLEEHNKAVDASLPGVVNMISANTADKPTLIDWQAVTYLSYIRDGIPHAIGKRIS